MFRTTAVLSLIASSYGFARFAPTMSKFSTRSVVNMVAKEGDLIPKVTFKCRVRDEKNGGPNPFTWKDVTTDDLFKNKRVALFALPGAFTPTCSSVCTFIF